MDYEEKKRMLGSFRGRRYLVCKAVDDLRAVISALPEGPYSERQAGVDAANPDLPGSTANRKREMENMANVLLRMVLVDNDGRISSDKINPF